MTLSKNDIKRLKEAESAMASLKQSFNSGNNRFEEYGRNMRDSYDRWAQVYTALTGQAAPSIYRS